VESFSTYNGSREGEGGRGGCTTRTKKKKIAPWGWEKGKVVLIENILRRMGQRGQGRERAGKGGRVRGGVVKVTVSLGGERVKEGGRLWVVYQSPKKTISRGRGGKIRKGRGETRKTKQYLARAHVKKRGGE